MQTRLGEHSSQLNHIHKTLDAFKKGELSKRDTHTSIAKTLDGHDDLKRGLMDFLMLPAAEWHADDFDLPMEQPTMSFVGSTPQILEPAHEPQMRLPSLSSNWLAVPLAEQSAGHVTSKDYNDPMTSFPTPPDFAPSHTSQPPTRTWVEHSASTLYPALNDEASLPPPMHTTFRDPWQTPKLTNTWPEGGLDFSPDSLYFRKYLGPATSPGASYDHQQELPLVYPRDTEPYQNLGSCQQMTVSPERTYSLMPSPTENSPTDKCPTTDSVSNSVSTKKENDMGAHAPQAPVLKSSPPYTQLAQDMDSPSHDFLAEPFIHSLCGKGFSTLSGVKKHHWGKKINDLMTKTGCWAKHNKPDVGWDDHPSCKVDRPKAKTTRSVAAVSEQGRPTTSTVKSEGSPALHVSHVNTVPGFPTLHDLPRTVAHAINIPAASSSGLEERAPLEHIHGTPSRSSFGDLLTAVNAVSQIDAPKPRARTDSIALHLDAQVTATERQSPFVPSRQSTDTILSYRARPDAQPAQPAQPGIYPASQRPLLGVASGHTSNLNSENPSVKSWPKAVESSATSAVSRPFRTLQAQSSGLAKKKRRI